MKIVSIRAYPLYASFERLFGGADKVPASMLAPASHFRLIPRTGQHSTVVEIRSDSGLVGIGEAFGLPHSQLTASLIEGVIAPALLGKTLTKPDKLLADLYTFFVALGHTRGPAIEAISGVDIAMWDLLAKQAALPLLEHLGGSLAPVPTYVSPVPYLALASESAEHARAFVQQGFKGLKLKIGRGLATDLEHIGAVREASGSKTELMLDANCAYAVDDAIALARELRPFSIAWLEEPILRC